MLKSEFESKKISQELSDYLEAHPIRNYIPDYSEQEESGEASIQVASENEETVAELPTYQNTFDFIRDVEGESDYIEYLNSANAEFLPMSISLKL